jgi:hypothetical protein
LSAQVVLFRILIETSKKQQIAVTAADPKRLPRRAWSGPFVKSAGGNYTTPVSERLGEGRPTLHSFSSSVDQIPAATLLVLVSNEPPSSGGQFAPLVFSRDNEVLLLWGDVVAWPIIGERAAETPSRAARKSRSSANENRLHIEHEPTFVY